MGLRVFKPSLTHCLNFPGSQNIQIPSSSALAFDSDFTYIVSLKISAGLTAQSGIMGTTNGGASGWEVILDANSNIPRITLRGTTTFDLVNAVGPTIRKSDWIRLVVSCSINSFNVNSCFGSVHYTTNATITKGTSTRRTGLAVTKRTVHQVPSYINSGVS